MPRQWTAWVGVSSCVVAGALMAVSQTAGRRARFLKEALEVAHLEDLAALASILPLVIAVTGRVCCSKPIKCEDGETEAPIVNATEQEHFLRQVPDGSWKHEKATVFNSTREVPWSLDDGSGVQLEVLNGREASNLDLTTIYDQYQPIGKTLFQSASDHIQGMRSLGVRRTERVLPVGTAVTAVGELTVGVPRPGSGVEGAGGSPHCLVLRRPRHGSPFYITTKSLPELTESLSSLSRICKYMAWGFGATGLLLLIQHGVLVLLEDRRRRKLRAQVRQARRMQPLPLPDSALEGNEDGAQRDRPDNTCVVCLERPLDAVFIKCGHMCCCIDCGSRLSHCPVCRRHTDVIRVYFP